MLRSNGWPPDTGPDEPPPPPPPVRRVYPARAWWWVFAVGVGLVLGSAASEVGLYLAIS